MSRLCFSFWVFFRREDAPARGFLLAKGCLAFPPEMKASRSAVASGEAGSIRFWIFLLAIVQVVKECLDFALGLGVPGAVLGHTETII